MPTPTKYIESIQETSALLSGSTAPRTGQYYQHLYSQDDPLTGVPTLGVELHKNEYTQQPSGGAQPSPAPINNLTDAQILEMVQSGKQVQQYNDTPIHTLTVEREAGARTYIAATTTTTTTLAPKGEAASGVISATSREPGNFSLGGIFMFGLLLALVGFVYFIVRTWQDHQAQKLVMTSRHKQQNEVPLRTEVVTPAITALTKTPAVEVTTAHNEPDWRKNIEHHLSKLQDVLHSKGVPGASVSDKLKAVKPGQFALADMAWEAQDSARKLLTAHDDNTNDADIKRTLQLFKQVFVEHKII